MSNINQNAIYAILADSVYWDVRKGGTKSDEQKTSNWTPIPSDWKLISELQDKSSGFTARAFKNSNFSSLIQLINIAIFLESQKCLKSPYHLF